MCEQYSPIERKEILTSATTWMDFEGIILSEISQTEKDECNLIYAWNFKKNKKTPMSS